MIKEKQNNLQARMQGKQFRGNLFQKYDVNPTS